MLRLIPGVEIVLYADDLAIRVLVSDMNMIEQIMNCALYTLDKWVEKNEMIVNTEKTNFQIFSMKNISIKPILFFNDSIVEKTFNQR